MPLEAHVEGDEELVWLVDDSTEVRISGRTFHCLQPGVFLVPPRFADALRSLIRDIPPPIRRTFKRYESDLPDVEEETAHYKALRKPRPLKRRLPRTASPDYLPHFRCLTCGRKIQRRVPGMCATCGPDPGTALKHSPGLKYQVDDEDEAALRDWIAQGIVSLETKRTSIFLTRKNENGRRIKHGVPLDFDKFGDVSFEGAS